MGVISSWWNWLIFFCFKWKSCWINGAQWSFQRRFVPFPTWVFLGCLKSFSKFDLPTVKTGFITCRLLSTLNAQYHTLILHFSASPLIFINSHRHSYRHKSSLTYPVSPISLTFPPFVAVVSELHVSDLPFPCLCLGCRISLCTATPSR